MKLSTFAVITTMPMFLIEYAAIKYLLVHLEDTELQAEGDWDEPSTTGNGYSKFDLIFDNFYSYFMSFY